VRYVRVHFYVHARAGARARLRAPA